jgi:L-serine dehydratase
MIGPSSSHTAGAIRIGLFARKIFGKEPEKVVFKLYNSFAKTGLGHGTDKAILGGILGFDVSDQRMKHSFDYAAENSLVYKFEYLTKEDRHPNSVDILFLDKDDNMQMKISANSVGGGEVQINRIDDFTTDIRGDYPVLVLVYKDQKGVISKVSGLIQEQGINIASLNCERREKYKEAVMTICLDSILPDSTINEIKKLPDMYLVSNIERLED